MRGKIPNALLVIVLLAAAGSWRLTTSAQGVTEAERQLQKAILLETVDGNLQAAIDQYKKIVAQDGSNRATTAKALLRLAGCYEKLGQAEAERAYRQLISKYPDQKTEVDMARSRLAGLASVRAVASGPTGGLKLTRIYAGESYASSISPDGTRLAITRSEMSSQDIWVRSIATGEEVRVTKLLSVNTDPVWAPNGRWMAFADRSRDVKIVPADGGEVKTVFTTEPGGRPIVGLAVTNWTSDSKKVVFRVPGKGLFAVPVAGGEAEPVCTFENPDEEKQREGLIASPDGRWVAYSTAQHGNFDIFVMRATGGIPIRITTSPAAERKPRWSPDGNWLAFGSLGNENPQIWAVRLSADRQAEGPPVQVSRDAQVFGGDWMAGGRLGFSAAFRTEHIFTAYADGTGETQLTRYSSLHAKPRWSPDGHWVAFSSDYRKPLNRFRLWIVSSDGGTPKPVSDTEIGSVFAWSGDGKKLLFETRPGPRQSAIMEIPAQGGEPKEILALQGDIDGLSLSPDGRSLYYTFRMEPAQHETSEEYLKGSSSGIGVVPVGGGEPRILIPADKKGIWYSDCRVDPEGKRLACMLFDYARYGMEGMYSIWTHDVDGRMPRKIANGGEYILCWSPDGKWIVYEQRIKDMDFELYRVPIGGGEAVRMNIRGRSAEFSPDGKRVAYSRRIEGGYEYWLAENVLPAQPGSVK